MYTQKVYDEYVAEELNATSNMMSDIALDKEIEKLEELDFLYREQQYLKRLPEKRFNPKQKKTWSDKIMEWVIYG